MASPLTDQAIDKIKNFILSGEFSAGSRLPREQDLAARLGLSRSSLREAVRALALVGVLDTRSGDGTYVTSLDSDLLVTGMAFVVDLLDGTTLVEVHQIRRILEPIATGLAASRLTADEYQELENCLRDMDEAATSQAFIDADTEFHRIIVGAAGSATLASLIQSLYGGTLRARLWRAISEHDAVEVAKKRHRDIYVALRAGDAERASAADLLHLAEVQDWLELMIAGGKSLDSADPGQAEGEGPRSDSALAPLGV